MEAVCRCLPTAQLPANQKLPPASQLGGVGRRGLREVVAVWAWPQPRHMETPSPLKTAEATQPVRANCCGPWLARGYWPLVQRILLFLFHGLNSFSSTMQSNFYFLLKNSLSAVQCLTSNSAVRFSKSMQKQKIASESKRAAEGVHVLGMSLQNMRKCYSSSC